MSNIPDSANDAKELLLKEAICWQHNGAREYQLAQEYKEMYLDGLVSNLARYEAHMRFANSFYAQARTILLALA